MACSLPPLPGPVVPTPPPPPPVPPPPPPPAPGTPPGVAQVSMDYANSTVQGDDPAYNYIYNMAMVNSVGYRPTGNSLTLGLWFQNLGTASGSLNVAVSVDDGGVQVTPASVQTINVPAKGTKQAFWYLTLVGGPGTYTVTIDNGIAKYTFKAVFNGTPPTGSGA